MQEQMRRDTASTGTRHGVRGWCPTAWRPMMAGDGLLVRVRPSLGRMSREQAIGFCEAALTLGSGHIDVTNRAAFQIRGVPEADHRALMERLIAIGLAHADEERDAHVPILINPDWHEGDDSALIATELTARLRELPDLPAKVGFAIDAGPAPVLSDASADFRVERAASGALILRADGRIKGTPVNTADAAEGLIRMAHRFVASGGVQAGRMARHNAPLSEEAIEAPAPARSRAVALAATPGPFHAAPFGRIEAAELLAIIADDARAVRVTPWRGLVLEGSGAPADDPSDPRLAADACPGAPACPQSSVATRELAARLAPYVPGLHVSGCAKGCARPSQAAVVLTGREGVFDLAFNARAGAPPLHAGLWPDQIFAHFGAH